MISVIIPTYKEPEYLDLCLKSCIEGQVEKNEIIVVVDGFYNENKEILDKWGPQILILDLGQNKGLPHATNMGVYNATNDWILIVNDDNVFSKGWDKSLSRFTNNLYKNRKFVVSPNQIEPNPSIFPQFKIGDLGKNINEFSLEKFLLLENIISDDNVDNFGGTLPIFTRKDWYLGIGGWDENYPTNGVVADWDFFFKCELIGIELLRDYKTNFYHFAQIATGTQRQITEQQGHEYFQYKWRKYYIPKALRK
jgi:glycosyltransferase involved in cell wall biosynthesis